MVISYLIHLHIIYFYLEQPHFINSHYYFKTIRHLIITALKGGGKQERRRDMGKGGSPLWKEESKSALQIFNKSSQK